MVRRLGPAMDDGVLALTLNPAAAGRGGNMMGTVPKRSYDYDDDNDNEHDHGFSITGFFWLTCNSTPHLNGYHWTCSRVVRRVEVCYSTDVTVLL